MHFLWVIIIGGIVGFIARLISPAPNNPNGIIMTVLLGIVGSIVATFLGRALHLYRPGQGAGIIGAIIGAVIVLAIWHAATRSSYSGGGYPPNV
jgi:uncharacterized membrane protein YeaQ/YmgE (transglycosylase-associated protein family)